MRNNLKKVFRDINGYPNWITEQTIKKVKNQNEMIRSTVVTTNTEQCPDLDCDAIYQYTYTNIYIYIYFDTRARRPPADHRRRLAVRKPGQQRREGRPDRIRHAETWFAS